MRHVEALTVAVHVVDNGKQRNIVHKLKRAERQKKGKKERKEREKERTRKREKKRERKK